MPVAADAGAWRADRNVSVLGERSLLPAALVTSKADRRRRYGDPFWNEQPSMSALLCLAIDTTDDIVCLKSSQKQGVDAVWIAPVQEVRLAKRSK